MRIKIIILFLGGLFMAALLAYAAPDTAPDPELIFRQAGEKYAAGEYQSAIRDYDTLLDEGYASGNLYYNKGNCYLKMNKLGDAILNYERARLYTPRDSDLLSNHRFALSLVKQKEKSIERPWYIRGLERLASFFTLKELWYMLMLLFYLLTFSIIASLFFSDARRYIYVAIPFTVIFLIAFLILFQTRKNEVQHMGVVVSEIVDARFEPSEKGMVNYPLYSGSHVMVITTLGDWRKIARRDGKIGWVPRASVTPVIE